jgi:hypothetical protein
LLAVATLAIGLLFIGGTFMTGVYLTTVSTERTIASVVVDEAFAKIELYGLDPNEASLSTTRFVPYEQVLTIPADEFLYPSTWVGETPGRQYSWSAVCKRVDPDAGPVADHAPGASRLVQFTVFVCRETGTHLKHWVRVGGALTSVDWPRPVRVTVRQTAAMDRRVIQIVDAIGSDTIDERAFINDGASIVDEATGQIYRVRERSAAAPDMVTLDRPLTGGDLSTSAGGGVWVVPPAISSGRNPVVGIYQRTLEF